MTDLVREIVLTGGYLGLAAVILLENLIPPIPSELVLPLAGYLVGTGELAFAWCLLAATAGSVAGALIIYGAARRGGRPLVLRHGRLLHVKDRDIDRAEAWFARWGDWLVLGGRLIPGARSLVSIPAGMAEMPVARFVVLTTLGSAVWNAVLIGAGYLLGHNHEAVASVVGPAGTAVLVLAAIGGCVVGWRWYRRRTYKPSSLKR